MALKIQQLTPAAGVLTAFAAVPAGKQWLWDINACNRAAASTTISIAVTVGSDTTYYNYETSLPANGVLERTGRKLLADGIVEVLSANGSVDFTLEYVEE